LPQQIELTRHVVKEALRVFFLSRTAMLAVDFTRHC
jgi:hypothetical protein